MDFTEIQWEDSNWIELARGRVYVRDIWVRPERSFSIQQCNECLLGS
jgi:hypothetical protein